MADHDDFDQHAQQAMHLARKAAQRFNHNYIGTEHLLIGIVDEVHGRAAVVLGDLGVEPSKVRSAIEFIIGRGPRPVVGEVGLTPRGNRAVDLAREEARRLGDPLVGTQHLLLGLIREGEGIAAGVLESLGVNLERVRARLLDNLATEADQSEPMNLAPSDLLAAGDHTPSPRPRWEYLVLETIRDGDAFRIFRVDEQETHRFANVSLHWTLQVLGDEAWELLGIDPPRTRDEGGTVYVFKRRKGVWAP